MRHARLTIDIHYQDPSTEEEVRDRLDTLVDRAAGEGMFTGDGPLEVDGWSHDVRFFGCVHEYDELSAKHADGATGIIDITCRHCGVSGSFAIPEDDINWE